MELKGKKIVVVGLAQTGLDTAEFLVGRSARVYLTEAKGSPEIREKARLLQRKGIELELGGHRESFLEGADLMVPSPGVEPQSLPIVWARANQVPIWSEIELAYRV